MWAVRAPSAPTSKRKRINREFPQSSEATAPSSARCPGREAVSHTIKDLFQSVHLVLMLLGLFLMIIISHRCFRMRNTLFIPKEILLGTGIKSNESEETMWTQSKEKKHTTTKIIN